MSNHDTSSLRHSVSQGHWLLIPPNGTVYFWYTLISEVFCIDYGYFEGHIILETSQSMEKPVFHLPKIIWIALHVDSSVSEP